MTKRTLMAMLALMVSFFVADTASAQRGFAPRWTVLGQQKVGFLVDKDVVRVGRDEGWLRAIRLTARGNQIEVQNVRIVYANGYSEDFPANFKLRQGQSQVVDLRGERAYLKEIHFTYRSKPSFKGQATMVVEGQLIRRHGR